jgi:hypothetical protein
MHKDAIHGSSIPESTLGHDIIKGVYLAELADWEIRHTLERQPDSPEKEAQMFTWDGPENPLIQRFVVGGVVVRSPAYRGKTNTMKSKSTGLRLNECDCELRAFLFRAAAVLLSL